MKAEWKPSENRQRAKYYSLTAAGRKQLGAEQSRWKQMTEAIAGLMEPKTDASRSNRKTRRTP